MHILLTNDDGVRADGLRALCAGFVGAGHRVSVCAPDRERSAASHSVTLKKPLRAEPVDFPGAERAWQVDGTPADCASLGLWLTREDPVDLVVAGINYGMNLGAACVYSGTVGAAMEASMCGAPALAVSLCVDGWDAPADFAPAARLAVRVAEWAAARPLPMGCLYNLNVPPIPYEAIRGLAPGRLAPVFMGAPSYRPVEADTYRFEFNAPVSLEVPEADASLIGQGYATITRLTWDCRLNAPEDDLRDIGM